MVRKLTYLGFVILYFFALALPAMATGSASTDPPVGDVAADPEPEQTGVVVEELIDGGNVFEPVSVAESDGVFPAVYSVSRSVAVDIGDEPPEYAPFYGSGFVSGRDDNLGRITLFIPVSYMDGFLGVDGDGNLMNISSSSITGYLDGVYNNSVSIPAFSYPRYRTANYGDYEYIYMVPENSNMEIATDFPGSMSMDEFIGYASILLLGVIVLCCMKRS